MLSQGGKGRNYCYNFLNFRAHVEIYGEKERSNESGIIFMSIYLMCICVVQ